jgi:hypothetical protein
MIKTPPRRIHTTFPTIQRALQLVTDIGSWQAGCPDRAERPHLHLQQSDHHQARVHAERRLGERSASLYASLSVLRQSDVGVRSGAHATSLKLGVLGRRARSYPVQRTAAAQAGSCRAWPALYAA